MFQLRLEFSNFIFSNFSSNFPTSRFFQLPFLTTCTQKIYSKFWIGATKIITQAIVKSSFDTTGRLQRDYRGLKRVRNYTPKFAIKYSRNWSRASSTWQISHLGQRPWKWALPENAKSAKLDFADLAKFKIMKLTAWYRLYFAGK